MNNLEEIMIVSRYTELLRKYRAHIGKSFIYLVWCSLISAWALFYTSITYSKLIVYADILWVTIFIPLFVGFYLSGKILPKIFPQHPEVAKLLGKYYTKSLIPLIIVYFPGSQIVCSLGASEYICIAYNASVWYVGLIGMHFLLYYYVERKGYVLRYTAVYSHKLAAVLMLLFLPVALAFSAFFDTSLCIKYGLHGIYLEHTYFIILPLLLTGATAIIYLTVALYSLLKTREIFSERK